MLQSSLPKSRCRFSSHLAYLPRWWLVSCLISWKSTPKPSTRTPFIATLPKTLAGHNVSLAWSWILFGAVTWSVVGPSLLLVQVHKIRFPESVCAHARCLYGIFLNVLRPPQSRRLTGHTMCAYIRQPYCDCTPSGYWDQYYCYTAYVSVIAVVRFRSCSI